MRSQSISEQIFNHALQHVAPFASEGGHTWVAVPTGPLTHQAWPLASIQFRAWLANSFQAEHGIYPGDQALRYAVTMIQARARFAPQPAGQDVFTRIGWRGDPLRPDALTIDLANPARDAVEITPSGWRITNGESWQFRYCTGARPLPRPISHSRSAGLPDSLGSLLNIDSGPTLHRLITWLFAAMRPAGPYPILILSGPPSSGKSVTARILRSLIDPAAAPLLALPQSERELFVLALHNRILAFDHVPTLSGELSVALARLAAGTAFTPSSRNPFDDPLPLAVERPVILTVPSTDTAAAHWSRNHTVSSLAITAQFDFIVPVRRRSHHDIAREFETAAPGILATLCNAVSEALGKVAETTVAAPSRFADAQQWTASASATLGLSVDEVNAALGATPLVRALTGLLAESGIWTGTPTDLVAALRGIPGLPTNTKSLAQALSSTPLAVFGIDYSIDRKMDRRLVTLSMTDAAKNLSYLTRTSVMD